MSKEEEIDSLSKNSASLSDMNDVEIIFKKYDANGDGKISLSELGAILKALGSETQPDELRRVMSEIDVDGDDFIDLEEFAVFHHGGSAGDGSGNDDLREAFDLYDRDKNGLISASELHAVLKSLGEKCTLKDCRRMISSVDADGDGAVNFEEFKKMMTRS